MPKPPKAKKEKAASRIIISTAIGLSKAVLVALHSSAVVFSPGSVSKAMYEMDRFEAALEGLGEFDQGQKKRALRYLRSKKLVEVQRQYDRDVYKLTKVGWFTARKLARVFAVEKPKKWDKKWRMVIFDIPVRKKSEAEAFRRSLRHLGMVNIQKSIWVYPHDCRDQVFYLAGRLKIEPSVRLVEADKITGEQDLKKRFGL